MGGRARTLAHFLSLYSVRLGLGSVGCWDHTLAHFLSLYFVLWEAWSWVCGWQGPHTDSLTLSLCTLWLHVLSLLLRYPHVLLLTLFPVPHRTVMQQVWSVVLRKSMHPRQILKMAIFRDMGMVHLP